MSYLVWSLKDLCDKGACRYDVLSGGRKGVPKQQMRVQSIPLIWSSDIWSFRPYGQISAGPIC